MISKRWVGYAKSKQKSKSIFWILSILAVIFLVLFSFSVGAGSVPMMILTLILLIAIFGIGFTLKKNIVIIIGYKLQMNIRRAWNIILVLGSELYIGSS